MKINKQLKYNVLSENIERDNIIIDDKTPSVYEYVKHAIRNEEIFLAWLFDDGDIESEDDLNEKQQDELDEFVKFCKNDDNTED